MGGIKLDIVYTPITNCNMIVGKQSRVLVYILYIQLAPCTSSWKGNSKEVGEELTLPPVPSSTACILAKLETYNQAC